MFEGIDDEGNYCRVILSWNKNKVSDIDYFKIVDHAIDRFFLIQNSNIGKNLKRKILIYANFGGEIGIYNFSNKKAYSY